MKMSRNLPRMKTGKATKKMLYRTQPDFVNSLGRSLQYNEKIKNSGWINIRHTGPYSVWFELESNKEMTKLLLEYPVPNGTSIVEVDEYDLFFEPGYKPKIIEN